MPTYDWRSDGLPPAVAFDAFDRLIFGYIYRIDTESGLCCSYEADEDGIIRYKFGKLIIDRFVVPAPIRIEFKSEDETEEEFFAKRNLTKDNYYIEFDFIDDDDDEEEDY